MPVISYKCPNCDGELVFNPGMQKFTCAYCRSAFTKEELGQTDEEGENEAEFAQHAVEYHCPSCGAEIVTDDTTAATFCFYCHNPVVLTGRLSGSFRPQKLIPFVIEKAKVREQFLAWCKKKKFIDKRFFSEAQMELLSGVYFPFWLTDCDMDANMQARAEKIRVWRRGDKEYTETEIYRLVRAGGIRFCDYTMAALSGPRMELTGGIYPYDFRAVKKFSMPYLSGFHAEKRNLERQQLEEEARAQLDQYARLILQSTMQGYSGLQITGYDSHVKQESWQYVLLPVWTMTYQYKGKTYYYAMNGQTGRVYGRVPLSFLRLCVLFGIVTAAVFALLLLGGMFL
jgi:DNA-directed RNA polymerase subunit RPC12/RpoP